MSSGKWNRTSEGLDRLDEQILWELYRDARLPNAELARRLHVAPSTTLTRLRALRQSGAYRSAHARVDLAAVGLPIQAVIAVRLRAEGRGHALEFERRIIRQPAVIDLFYIGGAEDFLVHVACTSTAQLRDFVTFQLSMDPSVASTQTHIVFDHLVGADHRDPTPNGFEETRRPLS
ncbi:MAG: Lrp/AsnC family transcriptional regulator [Bifidobacteriaceae bacterium]|nr:Lrp/AsnC family transcriptional regulator [Bifidobacteriaceae bacterium]